MGSRVILYILISRLKINIQSARSDLGHLKKLERNRCGTFFSRARARIRQYILQFWAWSWVVHMYTTQQLRGEESREREKNFLTRALSEDNVSFSLSLSVSTLGLLLLSLECVTLHSHIYTSHEYMYTRSTRYLAPITKRHIIRVLRESIRAACRAGS